MWKYRNISREEFAIIEWAQLRFGDISLSTLLENPDYNYALKQHERKNIENIKGRFGDVGLIELHNTFRTYSLELTRMAPGVIEDHMATKEASANLTDKHIEQLLNEKIENMDMYSFYNLANRKAGYQNTYYNGVKCDRNFDINRLSPRKLRRFLEEWHIRQFIPVIFAARITSQDWTFDTNGNNLTMNVIFYDTHSYHMFYTLDDWTYCYPEISYTPNPKFMPSKISRNALKSMFYVGVVKNLGLDQKSPILQIGKNAVVASR